MNLKKHLNQTVDTVRETTRNLTDKATNHLTKASAAAALILLIGAANNETEAQTTYIDTIPQEHKNLTFVGVTDDLLETLDMTKEEFFEQKVKIDFDRLNKAHYYSGNTNDINQQVEVPLGDSVTTLPTEGLPDEMHANDAFNYLQHKEDGVREEIETTIDCAEPHTIFLYGDRSNLGASSVEYVGVNGTIPNSGRPWTTQHEFAHYYGGWHYNQGSDSTARPSKIDTITPRVEEFVEANEGKIPQGDWIRNKWTVLDVATGLAMGLYSSPYIRPEGSKADMTRHIREKLASLTPPLAASITSPRDSVEVGSTIDLQATINRDEEDIDDYQFNWIILHDDQVVHTGTGETVTYMPTAQDTGTVTVELFAKKDCEGGQMSRDTIPLTVYEEPTAVDNPSFDQITMAPNPTNGTVELKGPIGSIKEIKILTMHGMELTSQEDTTIDLSRQPAGTYFIQLIDKHGNIGTKRIIKLD